MSFSAPDRGTYTFSTDGSDFDTVLYAQAGACEAEVLACSDDAPDGLFSEIVLALSAGQEITVVVDGFGQRGAWVLSVDRVFTCADAQFPGVADVVEAGVLEPGFDDTVSPTCGGSGPDVVFEWTPPSRGRYAISTAGSDFDTVLAVYGPECAGELACNDDSVGLQSSVTLDLEGGRPVNIAVDTFSGVVGDYILSIVPQ